VARETGELTKWFDDRGFGFIRRDSGGELYVHIKDIERTGQRPAAGDRVSFATAPGKNGRPSAVRVQIVVIAPAPAPEAPPRQTRPAPPPILLAPRIWAAATLLALLAADIIMRILPVLVAALYLIAGACSFYLYRLDKHAAGRNYFRTPERKLHLLDLTFGIIGGLLAQHYFRHKTFKSGFVMTTALITALHVLVLGFIFSDVFAPGKLGQALRALPGHLGQ
jgi:uncharacterized membrane protein YsdA (DUF1294 family)/cold shock CspA family protein